MMTNEIIKREQPRSQKKPEIQENIKMGGTLVIVSQIFAEKQDKQTAWLSIITRAENLKSG